MPLLPSCSNKPEIGAYPEAARYLVLEHTGTPPFLANVLVVMSEAARCGERVCGGGGGGTSAPREDGFRALGKGAEVPNQNGAGLTFHLSVLHKLLFSILPPPYPTPPPITRIPLPPPLTGARPPPSGPTWRHCRPRTATAC